MQKFSKTEYLAPHGSLITAAKVVPKIGNLALTGDDSGVVSVWRFDSERPLLNFSGNGSSISAVNFLAKPTLAVAGTQSGSVNIWDLETQKVHASVKGHRAACNLIVPFQTDTTFVATCAADKTIKIWDLRKKGSVATYKGHTSNITSAELSPDCRWIAAGDESGSLKLWDLSTGKVIQEFDHANQSIESLQFNPMNLSLAVGTDQGTLYYYCLETFRRTACVQPLQDKIVKLRFDPNGKVLFSAAQSTLTMIDMDHLGVSEILSPNWKNLSDVELNYSTHELHALTNNTGFFGIWNLPINELSLSNQSPMIKPTGTNMDLDKPTKVIASEVETRSNYQKENIQSQFNQDKTDRMSVDRNTPNEVITLKRRSSKIVTTNQTNSVQVKSISKESQASALNSDSPTTSNDTNSMTFNANQQKQQLHTDQSPQIAQNKPQSRSDLEIINELMGQHSTVLSVLNNRANQAKIVLKYWGAKNVASAINAIKMMNDDSAIMDFLKSSVVDSQNSGIFNMEQVLQLLQFSQKLVESKFESYLECGIQSARKLLFEQQNTVALTLSATQSPGVDLSKEERVGRCKEFVKMIKGIVESQSLVKATQRESFPNIMEIAQLLQTEGLDLLNKC